ncbi:MAG: serine protease [Paracoccaceae bacterium]|nr:serine protease [Paracoccaceae bacterium]MDG1738794.1 serine protease [Paracoccaceae bacterium]MDG2259391.1 serine protease [Paracoccaceae bacterium]
MLRNVIAATILIFISIAPVNAQSVKSMWIQVETLDTEEEALGRILAYKTFLPAIAGFKLPNGEFGVVVGPFSELESKYLLTQFSQTGLIPPDSFISPATQFGQQFYPPNEDATVENGEDRPKETKPDTLLSVDENGKPILRQADETNSQARASERLLSKDDKKLLQSALKDAGFYTGDIDGLYGRGTRASMSRWQDANHFEDTGILTTAQRAELLNNYYAALDGLGMQLVEDRAAGIAIEMPTNAVSFDGYTAPFAHFIASDGSEAGVHLISQPGDRTSLYALYDVMQTLSIVPLEGRRKKNRNNFVLTGANDKIISHTEAYLSGGEIKGFTLVWPADRADQAQKLIDRMQRSFERQPGVLPRGQGTDIEPGQAMLGGLDLRKATSVVSGAFINDVGMVITTSEITESCERIAAFDDTDFELIRFAPELGLSLLAPKTGVQPIGFGTVRAAPNRLNTRVSASGYSFGGTLSAPSLTHGSIAATTGLQGEEHVDRLELSPFVSDAGGPVLGSNGEIVGILNAANQSGDRQLPSGVSFMTDNATLSNFLTETGVDFKFNVALDTKSAVEIERMAADMTVWISCWE